MLGLIITTQVVSYPMFHFVNKNNFSTYHNNYVNYVSTVVIPTMVLELGFSILLFLIYKSISFFIPLFINIMILITTYFIQVPIHNILGQKFNKQAIDRLIKTNWLRTLLWTVKVFLLVLIILKENIV
tara:strand:- start:1512 stop:1895 length:384 start_codon:yes stop_codon:yes gene_type:complete